MASDLPTTPGNSQPSRPRRAGARPDPFPLLQGLDRIRDFVHQRLDRIEALSLERGASAAASSADPSEREQELRRRLAEAEERQGRIVAEARRREQEWLTGLEQIENDRKLLAEAWERLERERIDGTIAAHAPQPHRGGAAPQPRAAAPQPPQPQPQQPAQAYRPVAASEANDVITHAILQQFQALRSDVRRNANGRRPRR
jgi:hypothetical protein